MTSQTSSRPSPSVDTSPPSPITLETRVSSFLRLRGNRKAYPLQDWHPRQPYHNYCHRLVAAGWENLQELDKYLSSAPSSQPGLVVSVLDISSQFQTRQWPDINSEYSLTKFLDEERKPDGSVRMYMAEYDNVPSTGVIEAFGASLKLDPRFFNWAIKSKGHVFTTSQRHRAPYINLGFGVLDPSTPQLTDALKFKVLVYIKPDEVGKGWTGVIFFSSHARIALSPRIITDPPPFLSPLPLPTTRSIKTFRELFLASFEFTSPQCAFNSPFYAISALLRLNCFCWNEIITTIREEDHRINGISDTSIGHAEEVRKTLAIVQRGGSLSWLGRDYESTKDVQEALVEDFSHLCEQTDLLWVTRQKMASIQQKNAETKWTSLTNAFTYVFAPVTIISGIYGMNVSQISGSSSNPNIWQFFVAVAVLNIAVVLVLCGLNWIQILLRHQRRAGMKEIFEIAVGGTGKT